MKRFFWHALSLLVIASCSKFDDSAIWDELSKHEERIVKLETLCNQMNTNITSLQTIIIALQSNDYVVNIAPIKEGNKEIGYTITFAKSGSITIYHGQDGKNGQNGADGKDGVDGKDGQDGYTPKIGVRQHTDGNYYWTLDGIWLLDDSGNMIPTTGEDGKDGANGADGADGKDGQNGKDGEDGKNGQDGSDGKDGVDGVNGTDGKDGKDGITPQLKIEDGYWYLSYDNGVSWQKLGKATGNNGLDGANGTDGEDGDSIIDSITQDKENVYFNLKDGTLIALPKRNTDTIVFEDLNVKAICCKNWDTNNDGELSYAEAAAVKDIGDVFSRNSNIIAFNEFKYFTGVTKLSAKAFTACRNLWKISIPENVICFEDGNAWGNSYGSISNVVNDKDHYGTFLGASITNLILPEKFESIGISALQYTALKSIKLNKNLKSINKAALKQCYELDSVELPDGLIVIDDDAFAGCSKLTTITIPESVTNVGAGAFSSNDKMSIIYCKPSVPPVCSTRSSYDGPLGHTSVSGKIIYVPMESLDAYKKAEGWEYHKSLIYGYDFN